MSKSKKMKSVRVNGRRWFDRHWGNTYCASEIVVDDEIVAHCEMEYGYDQFYMQAAADKLEAMGYMPDREHYSNGGAQALWRYCQDRGIKCEYSATDVGTRAQLEPWK